MPLALYMNEHVPKAITIGLRVRGVDVLTVQEDDRKGSDDAELLDRAVELHRIMFSFDADMLRETARMQRHATPFTGLVFAHPSRISVGECVRDLQVIAEAGEPSDVANRVIYLPL